MGSSVPEARDVQRLVRGSMMQSMERSSDSERVSARCLREKMNREKIMQRSERGKVK
jgi:hypothetical protein